MQEFERSVQFRVADSAQIFELRARRVSGGGGGGGRIDPGELVVVGDQIEPLTQQVNADVTLVVTEPWMVQAPHVLIDAQRFLDAFRAHRTLMADRHEIVIDAATFGIEPISADD